MSLRWIDYGRFLRKRSQESARGCKEKDWNWRQGKVNALNGRTWKELLHLQQERKRLL